jgi:hypothetical protein
MTTYVYLENGEILEQHHSLPRAWRNISGFNHLASDIPKLNSLGWYILEKRHDAYDPELVKVTGIQHALQDGVVLETLVLEPLSAAEIDQRHQQRRNSFLEALRTERNRRMFESDWTQVLDVNYAFPPAVREAWRGYRQALRDLPDQYQDLEDYRNVEITWPEPPR